MSTPRSESPGKPSTPGQSATTGATIQRLAARLGLCCAVADHTQSIKLLCMPASRCGRAASYTTREPCPLVRLSRDVCSDTALPPGLCLQCDASELGWPTLSRARLLRFFCQAPRTSTLPALRLQLVHVQALCRAIVEDVRDSRPLTEEEAEEKERLLLHTGRCTVSHSPEVNAVLKRYAGTHPLHLSCWRSVPTLADGIMPTLPLVSAPARVM